MGDSEYKNRDLTRHIKSNFKTVKWELKDLGNSKELRFGFDLPPFGIGGE